jgi:hypothetical protein
MKITEAIGRADALYPNSYTREEKLNWAYELTAMIYEQYKKTYDSVELYGGMEGIQLPPSVLEEDVEGLYVDGVWYDKVDARSFEDLLGRDAAVKIVYKVRPEPYEEPIYEGSYLVHNNGITIPDTYFRVGDRLRITHGESEEIYTVMDTEGKTYFFKEDFTFQGETELTVQKLVTADTPVPPPYDSMYVDFLLGKIAYCQNDYEEQNKHMTQLNAKLGEYANWYKQTNPVKTGVAFRAMW